MTSKTLISLFGINAFICCTVVLFSVGASKELKGIMLFNLLLISASLTNDVVDWMKKRNEPDA